MWLQFGFEMVPCNEDVIAAPMQLHAPTHLETGLVWYSGSASRATVEKPIHAPKPPTLTNEKSAEADLKSKVSCLVSCWIYHLTSSALLSLVQVLCLSERGCEGEQGRDKAKGAGEKVCRAWFKGYQPQQIARLSTRGLSNERFIERGTLRYDEVSFWLAIVLWFGMWPLW